LKSFYNPLFRSPASLPTGLFRAYELFRSFNFHSLNHIYSGNTIYHSLKICIIVISSLLLELNANVYAHRLIAISIFRTINEVPYSYIKDSRCQSSSKSIIESKPVCNIFIKECREIIISSVMIPYAMQCNSANAVLSAKCK